MREHTFDDPNDDAEPGRFQMVKVGSNSPIKQRSGQKPTSQQRDKEAADPGKVDPMNSKDAQKKLAAKTLAE